MNQQTNNIRYVERRDIDIQKWDYCIENAPNGLIYARSFYLDAMAEKWSALISGDYETVMPLTWNRKYGISYLYQPAFTAQLGIFLPEKEYALATGDFIRHAKNHFRFCEIHLNHQNQLEGCSMRANYILPLENPYAFIRGGYKKRLLENLAEADGYRLEYSPANDFPSVIAWYQKEYGSRFPHIKKMHYLKFGRLCEDLSARKMLFLRQVKDDSANLLSASIFFTDHHRIYNIMSVTAPAGREKRSHFLLIDQLIREYASRPLLLDFEGSEIPGVAEFYRKFGSENQPYPFLYFNNLPFPLRYLK